MPQSFAAVYVHVVFSTKNREPTIHFDWRERLFQYIGGIVKNRNCELLSAGGVPDHVHLLISLGRECSLADLLRDLKANSSRWVHDEFPDNKGFAWQAGYGAFSVSSSNIDAVRKYIENQSRHHASQSFQDEFRELLRRHGLTWDERFVWD